MPDSNCFLTRTSPEHAIQMILQVRHLNSRYVVVYSNIVSRNTMVLYIFVNTAHSC